MVISKSDPASTQFLNVDLDIYSTRNLQPLVAALGKAVIVLHIAHIKRTYGAHLEVVKLTKTPDAAIREFCSLIKRLPRAERALWDAAKVRDFNIGIQAGLQPYCTEFALEAETIRATSDLGARIVLSVYAPDGVRPPPTATTHSKKAVRAIR